MPKRRRMKRQPGEIIRLTLDVEAGFYEEITVAALVERTPKAKLIRKAIALYLEQMKVEVRSGL